MSKNGAIENKDKIFNLKNKRFHRLAITPFPFPDPEKILQR